MCQLLGLVQVFLVLLCLAMVCLVLLCLVMVCLVLPKRVAVHDPAPAFARRTSSSVKCNILVQKRLREEKKVRKNGAPRCQWPNLFC